jgi:hypothetical protein
LFPHDCVHVENLGGDIGKKELHNRRLILGAFPWKFKGGEAAFCRAAAFTDEAPAKPIRASRPAAKKASTAKRRSK